MRWNKEQIQALKKSIKHWEEVVAGRDISYGALECACCRAFSRCEKCPIGIYTGKTGCEGTPYDRLMDARYEREVVETYGKLNAKEKKLAQEVLDFLRELLIEGQQEED